MRVGNFILLCAIYTLLRWFAPLIGLAAIGCLVWLAWRGLTS